MYRLELGQIRLVPFAPQQIQHCAHREGDNENDAADDKPERRTGRHGDTSF
jgi:hypothetical protein